MEDLSRIAPYSTFLANNPDIHVNGKPSFIKNILKDLGISEDRLVTGVVEAQVLYQPMGSRCGYEAFFPLHVFSNSTKRWFENHGGILNMLKKTRQYCTLAVSWCMMTKRS